MESYSPLLAVFYLICIQQIVHLFSCFLSQIVLYIGEEKSHRSAQRSPMDRFGISLSRHFLLESRLHVSLSPDSSDTVQGKRLLINLQQLYASHTCDTGRSCNK